MADQADTTTGEDIIASTSTHTTEGSSTPTTDALAELVGEGKKFKDIAALAVGKVESDKFIDRLKKEAADLLKSLNRLLPNTHLLRYLTL